MKSKILKRCFAVLISVFLFFTVREISKACAEMDFGYTTNGYSLFPQELIGTSSLSPFLFEPSQPYFKGLLNGDTLNPWSSNTQEWAEFLGKPVSEQDASALVYKSNLHTILELKNAIENHRGFLNDTLKRNSGANVLLAKSDMETASYLLYAKQVEPLAMAGKGDWDSNPAKDSMAMLQMSMMAEGMIKKVKRPFLSARYAFQAARMAHYCGQYQRCLGLCKTYASLPVKDSYIDRGMQSLQAGAMKHLGDYADARYHFAMMFDRYYKENYDFYYSNFAYSTPMKWSYDHGSGYTLPPLAHAFPDSSSGYQFCKNSHEKTVMYFLDAYGGNSPEVETMKKIFALDPGSEYLDVLLIRSFSEIEANGFFHKRKMSPKDLKEYKYDGEPLAPFRKFITDVLHKGGLKRPYLWDYALGHLAYMQKDYAAAKASFAEAVRLSPANVPTKEQADIMEILMEVELAPRIDAAFESNELKQIKFLSPVCKKDDRERYLFLRLAQRYDQQGDSVKAICCYSQTVTAVDLTDKAETHPLVKLLDWLNKPDKSEFEEYLETRSGLTIGEVNEVLGTVYIRANRLSEASSCFSKAGKLEPLPADPFLARMNDCHDCDYSEKKGTVYTKLTLVQHLMDLEKQSNSEGPAQAQAAFEAGNAYYNMSYFGNTWMSQAYFRSSWDSTDQYLDCSTARYFYAKARKLSDDREFQAKCSFMEAKCEQNAYYQAAKVWNDTYYVSHKGYSQVNFYTSFAMLKRNYADTKFYQEVIHECSYFRIYLGGKQ